MQVRQRLKINVAVSVITALAVLLMLFLAISRVNRALEASDIADDLTKSAFERSSFREDYLRTNSERARIQWLAKFEQIGGLLKAALEKFPDAEDRKTIDELIEDLQATENIFSAIVENRGKSGMDADSAALSQEIDNRLRTQLSQRLYRKILLISELHDSARGNLFSALMLAGWGIFFAFALITAAAVINSWTMGRTITDRVMRLRDGASIIGGGNLDHRIDVKGDDEFSELSGSFNAMTAKLRGSYDDLRNEIEERTRAEEALRTSERHYHSLFENMGEGFAYCKMLFDDRGDPADFVYLDVNSAFGRLTGLENVIGKKVTEAIPGIKESHPELFEIYGRVALTGSPEKIDIEFTPLNIWLSLSVYSVEKGYFVVVFDNITERKKVEEERSHALRIAEERTIELEAAIGELEGFTYSVAHDLRAPIRHMASYSQLLKEASWPVLGEKSRTFLTSIMEASGRLGILIDELLEFSRAGRKDMLIKPVDLDRLVREIARGLSEETGDRTIEWNVASLPEVYGDPSMLLLVFSNLLANAVKFTRNRSAARIEVGSAETPEAHIVHVKDNGIGFDMEYYNKLFGVFQRLHTTEEFEGTGIGLANVQRIILRHGGRVWAEGKVNEGATFYLSLPKEKQDGGR